MPTSKPTTIALGIAAGIALPALGAAAAKAKLRRDSAALLSGDLKPLLSNYADDATLRFPGANSWGRDYRGKDEIGAFFKRFIDVGLTGDIEEILVTGPPWNTTIAVRFNDRAHDAEGRIVYENRAILWVKASWGKIRAEEVYEDTEKATAFDEYLSRVEAPA